MTTEETIPERLARYEEKYRLMKTPEMLAALRETVALAREVMPIIAKRLPDTAFEDDSIDRPLREWLGKANALLGEK